MKTDMTPNVKIIKDEDSKTASMSVTFAIEWPNHDDEAAERAGRLFGELLARVIDSDDDRERLLEAFEKERFAAFGR